MISIVIPAYNEEKILRQNILRLRDFLEKRSILSEIIVISNGSNDQTPAICQDLAKQYPWFRFFSLPERSVGRAFSRGVREARSGLIVSMDADLSVDLGFIEQAQTLLGHADMVVGSKTLGTQKRSWVRVLGSQFYLFVTQSLFQMTITDFSMSAKAYRRTTLLPILDQIDAWTAYVFEICVWLIHNQKTVLQIGVACEDHRKSHFNIWHEGLYRYRNLYRVWKQLQDKQSWFHQVKAP